MPRALSITVGPEPPMLGERIHWQRLGMHLAHLLPPGDHPRDSPEAAPPGEKLADFLRLETRTPDASDLTADLLSIQQETPSDTFRARLREFLAILGELRKLALEDALGKDPEQALFEAWASCLPTYPRDADPGDLVIDLPTGESAEGVPLRASRRERVLKHLPEPFEEFLGGRAKLLLSAIERYFDIGGSESVLGDWLEIAKRQRLRPRNTASLGDQLQEAVFLLFEYYLSEDVDGVGPAPEGVMSRGYAHALRGEWGSATEAYEQAATEYARVGDKVGEWYARVSRRGALMSLSIRPARNDTEADQLSRQIEQQKIRIEQQKITEIQRTPEIARHTARRADVTRGALEVIVKRAEQRVSPTRFLLEFSSAGNDVWTLLSEERQMSVLPGYSQPLASLAFKLDGNESEEDLQFGLDFYLSELRDLLARASSNSGDVQRRYDEDLSTWLQRQFEAGREPSRPTHLTPALAQILTVVAPRLTANCVHSALSWLAEEHTKAGRIYEHAFGWSAVSNLDAAIVKLVWIAESNLDSWKYLLEYSDTAIARDPQFFWQTFANAQWPMLLPGNPALVAEIARWHLNHLPEANVDGKSHVEENWLRSLTGALGAGRQLGYTIEPALADSLRTACRASYSRESGYIRLLEVLDGPPAVTALLVEASESLTEPQRVRAASHLAASGVSELTDFLPGFSEQLSLSVSRTTDAPVPGDHFHGVESPFQLVSACLAIGVGEPGVQRDWLLEAVRTRERAPLSLLAASLLAGRWDAPQRQALFIAVSTVVSEVRDYHVLGLVHLLCSKGESQLFELFDRQIWASFATAAVQAVESEDTSVSAVAVDALISLAARTSELQFDALVSALLIDRVRWVGEHARSTVRRRAGYRLGEAGSG